MKTKRVTANIDRPEEIGAATLSKMSKREIRKLAKGPRIRKHIDPVIVREKEQRKSKNRQWWASNWLSVASIIISLMSMIVSLIALLQ